MNMQPDVILSAGNIAHYHHTAIALHQAGLLKRYYCTFTGLTGSEKWAALMPENWRKRLMGKRIDGLDKEWVRTIPFPYLAAQALQRSSLFSKDQSNLIFSTTFDIMVKRQLEDSRLFHWVHSLGLESAQKAKRIGSLCICDVRAAHFNTQERILRDEYELLGMPYPSPSYALSERLQAELALADYLFVNSDYAARTYIAQGYPIERVFILPRGVDLNRFRAPISQETPFESSSKSLFRILYIGQITPTKGIHYLIQAFVNLGIADSRLVLVGRIEPNYKALLDRMRPTNAEVVFIGHVPQIELSRYYQESDLFVFPSLSDGFGMVVTEAMASGLPVIVSENTGAKDIVKNGQDGFIVPSHTAEALQEKMLYMYQNPETRRVMGKSAAKRVRLFSWERYGERLLTIYDQILSRTES